MSAQVLRHSPFAVFRNRSFALLWSGEFVSTIGNGLTDLAATILVYRLTGSALSVGLMLIAAAAPSFLLGLLAGVVVDRVDRKRVMIVADIVRAALVLLIPLLLPFGIGWLYALVALSQCANQFFEPAHDSVVPELANEDDLEAANALMQISSAGSSMIGFAGAGIIAALLPIEWAFYIDAGTFLVSMVCVWLMRVARHAPDTSASLAGVLTDLRQGARVLFNSPALRALFSANVPVFFGLGLINALLLPYATRVLHATTIQYGLMEGFSLAGFVVASLLLAGLSRRLAQGQWLVISWLGMSLSVLVMILTASPLVAIIINFVSGMFNSPSTVARQVIIANNTKPETRGRVFSSFFMLRSILFVLGMAAAGLADIIDLRLLLLVTAGLLLAGVAITMALPGLGRPFRVRRGARAALVVREPELNA